MIKKTSGVNVTLTNILQTVIIVVLSILGWVFADTKKTITTMDEKVDEIQISQAVINARLVQNDKEHKEIKEIIKEIKDK
jgi:hypothetical protein